MIFLETLKKENKIRIEKPVDLPRIVMQSFSNFYHAYAKAYNKRYHRKGALFIDYVKRKEVINEPYFSKLIHYIHHHPVHHGFCKDVNDREFSSFSTMLSDKKTRLEKEEVLSWFGDKADYLKFHNSSLNVAEKEIRELEFN